jgi:hypothetical protein
LSEATGDFGLELAQPEFAAGIHGERNATTGARWNSPGNGVLYASFTLSLSVLEAFVHLPPAMRINLPEMTAIRIHVPDEARWGAINLSNCPPISTARKHKRAVDSSETPGSQAERPLLARCLR